MIKMFLILCCCGMLGCATTQINMNGLPAPKTMSMLTNPETGIQVYFSLIRYYEYVEGDESVILPEFIDVVGKNELEKNTHSVIFKMNIQNQNKTTYTIIKQFSNGKKNVKIYSGNMSINSFSVEMDIGRSAFFFYSDEDLLFIIGEIYLTIK